MVSLDKSHLQSMAALKELIDASRPIQHVMAFIDGGYLRALCKQLYNTDKIAFERLGLKIREAFRICLVGQFQLDLIRIYYYDAIVEPTHEEYKAQKEYFDSIRAPLFTVQLGYLIPSPKEGFRQKGVDILMAIDALTKAYRNQYDTGIFLLGDRDFIPLIKAVNDAGKKTVCIYYPPNSPKELVRSFDMSMGLGKSEIKDLLKK